MKKYVAVLLALILAATLFAGCAGKSESSSTSSSSVSSGSASSSSSSRSSSSKSSSSISSSSSSSSSSSVSGPEEITGFVPSTLNYFFTRTLDQSFPAGRPEPASGDGGSNWYKYQESPRMFLLYPAYDETGESLASGIAGDVQLLFGNGTADVSVAQLRERFGTALEETYSEMDGQYFAIVNADGYEIFFYLDGAEGSCTSFLLKPVA